MSKSAKDTLHRYELDNYRNGSSKTVSLGKMPTTDWGKLIEHMRAA
jgi:hypothetical protein